jgi:hypothetical protein
MKKASWVRYAKKSLKMGGKAPKYRSGRVVLTAYEAETNPIGWGSRRYTAPGGFENAT